jgi:uncharacterized membrane protein YkvA (DUF1232 family)
MSATAEQKVAILQRFVDRYADDLRVVLAAFGDAGTPPAAQRLLAGGMNYGLDMLDIFPDHYKGLGIADDAMVLRLAAKLAVAAGASDPALAGLADESGDVAKVFEELTVPLEHLVAKLPEREVRGRTGDRIVEHKDTRVGFVADIGREAKRHVPGPIDQTGGPERAIIELRKMAKHALDKAGLGDAAPRA